MPGTEPGADPGADPAQGPAQCQGPTPERALDPVTWLTYDELAERLGIERESARTLVKRKRWSRQPGNDGKVRIGVPDECLDARGAPGTEAGAAPAHVPEADPVQPPDHVPVVVEVLTRHVERLEAALEAAQSRAADRDAVATERDLMSAQVEALRGALAASEKDRDRWHETATRALEPVPHRPWWIRMAG